MISVGRIDKLQHTVLPLQHLNIGLYFGCHFVRDGTIRRNARHSHGYIADKLRRLLTKSWGRPFMCFLHTDHFLNLSELRVHLYEQGLHQSRMVNTDVRDKQSFHFIVRSGLAGGVAGCVVSHGYWSTMD